MKDTSLVRVISVYEIIWVGESFIKKGMIWPLLLHGVLLTVQRRTHPGLGWFERKLSYFK